MLTDYYDSPLGPIILVADEIGLAGLWFDEQKCFGSKKPATQAKSKIVTSQTTQTPQPNSENVTVPTNSKNNNQVNPSKPNYKNLASAQKTLDQAKLWLDTYFSGREPNIKIPFRLIGTDFQIAVWNILVKIPYAKTITYGEIANQIAAQFKKAKMSAQAVGGAVGCNNISLIIPCHRVVGKDGSLTGYGSGLDRKITLLELERTGKINLPALAPTRKTRVQ